MEVISAALALALTFGWTPRKVSVSFHRQVTILYGVETEKMRDANRVYFLLNDEYKSESEKVASS